MTLISSIAGPPILIALGFALSLMAAASLILLAASAPTIAAVEPLSVRTFKRKATPVHVKSGRSGLWGVGSRSVSVETPYGLSCAQGATGAGSSEFVFTPSLAGRFEDLSMRLTDSDLLGLFTQEKTLPLRGFVLESLPISLSSSATRVLVTPFTLGEVPSGRRGGSQEVYAVERYQGRQDSRDVVWKRVARSPVEEIFSRVREGNVRKLVEVQIVLGWQSEAARARLLDLLAEALGQLGRLLLEAGTSVEFSFALSGRRASAKASNAAELAEAVLGVFGMEGVGTERPFVLPSANLLVLSPESYARRSTPAGGPGAPVLLLSENPARPSPGGALFCFSGREDLTQLAVELVER